MTEPNDPEADFLKLLRWLDPDPQRAGEVYEQIRRSLIQIFIWRGCSDAEDLADDTIARVTRKIDKLAGHYQGDPALYFYGVAKRVLHEYRKRRTVPLSPRADAKAVSAPEVFADEDEKDRVHECLARCLERLSADDRELILLYYEKQGQAKIDVRKELAREQGVLPNTLRVRLYRIRATLRKCIEECVREAGVK